jgi:hypothetical protein
VIVSKLNLLSTVLKELITSALRGMAERLAIAGTLAAEGISATAGTPFHSRDANNIRDTRKSRYASSI